MPSTERPSSLLYLGKQDVRIQHDACYLEFDALSVSNMILYCCCKSYVSLHIFIHNLVGLVCNMAMVLSMFLCYGSE